eukprot:CAMPEP_0184399872 /NCGR_PEP_ID=MMETSP0007-20130409/72136_1 /TAXON_ID=97485 /ORGANISM="Prymnesium parvum, Strain Texoma1" /LENGTH=91 /DNA_ID=CAMNT_0026754485 /DNA_START=591 /DNA_END=866 /DNA_ORIENTATION=+
MSASEEERLSTAPPTSVTVFSSCLTLSSLAYVPVFMEPEEARAIEVTAPSFVVTSILSPPSEAAISLSMSMVVSCTCCITCDRSFILTCSP